MMAGKAEELKVASHIGSTIKKLREVSPSPSFFLFHPGPQPVEWCCCIQDDLSSSLNLFSTTVMGISAR